MRSAAFSPPTRRRLLPFKEEGRGRACCRNLPFKSAFPFLAAVAAGAERQLPRPRRPPGKPHPCHGVLDHLPAGGVSARGGGGGGGEASSVARQRDEDGDGTGDSGWPGALGSLGKPLPGEAPRVSL